MAFVLLHYKSDYTTYNTAFAYLGTDHLQLTKDNLDLKWIGNIFKKIEGHKIPHFLPNLTRLLGTIFNENALWAKIRKSAI